VTRLRPEGEPVETWGGEETPAGFVWQQRSHHVVEVGTRWRVQTRWWDQAGHPAGGGRREYVKVATDTGLLCLLYRDLDHGGWFLARIYD
jgi:hypothetical protein